MVTVAQEDIEIAKEMTDLANEEVMTEAVREIRPSAAMVRQAAKELTDYALKLKNKNDAVIQQLSSLDTDSEMSVLNFSKKYVKEESEYRELMARLFVFQDLANEFLGQKVIMTFVKVSPTTGQVELLHMENSPEDLSVEKASKSHGGDITGRITSMKRILAHSQNLINSDYDANNKRTLDFTFQEVWQRYRISKSRLKLKAGSAFILWKIKDWDGVWISGAGPLGEAYVAFFINKYIFTNNIEKSVQDFMMNKAYGAILADNASGFLKGDVAKGALNFGVKMKGAQPLSYIEIIKYAQEVQEAANVEKYLKNLQKTLEDKAAHNLVKPLSEFTRDEYEGILSTLTKRMNSMGKTFDYNQKVEIFKN